MPSLLHGERAAIGPRGQLRLKHPRCVGLEHDDAHGVGARDRWDARPRRDEVLHLVRVEGGGWRVTVRVRARVKVRIGVRVRIRVRVRVRV